jgi:ribosomal protein S18 acetylase RimI-like enzyme
MQVARPVVRRVVDEDFQEIADEYVDEGPNPLNPFSSIDQLKQIPRHGFLVAEVDGAYAGFLYWFSSTETGADGATDQSAHIAEVKVRREFWNRKVGETLLSHALKDIEKQEIPLLYVRAPEANSSLCALYEEIGFATFARTLHMRYLYPPDRHRTQRPHDEARELAVLLVELREQCRMFITAYTELTKMISRGPPLDKEGQRVFSARIWSRIQAALASCSVVSKILWPSTFPRQDRSDLTVAYRGRELRQILKLRRDASPLPIAVRNA